VVLREGEGKQARLNGARLTAAEQLRHELSTLVFTPDRLVVVKGGPAGRRAYFDRVLGRLWPGRSALPADYAAAVGQRNAALRRCSAGAAPRDTISPWTAQVASLGARLVDARRETLAALAQPLAEHAAELGLPAAVLRYEAEPPTEPQLEARLDRDLERGTTGLGPHLDEIGIASEGRDLRSFGSQGEQRLAVLALLLAEGALLAGRGPAPPLLLLDDVLSELDRRRRDTLVRLLPPGSQALITATEASALPGAGAQVLEVSPGTVLAA